MSLCSTSVYLAIITTSTMDSSCTLLHPPLFSHLPTGLLITFLSPILPYNLSQPLLPTISILTQYSHLSLGLLEPENRHNLRIKTRGPLLLFPSPHQVSIPANKNRLPHPEVLEDSCRTGPLPEPCHCHHFSRLNPAIHLDK